LKGDFNIDLFKTESCDYANYFTEQLFTSSFFPLITKATRITHHIATLIDNIFTNNLEQLDDSINGIIFSDISDHLPIVHICLAETYFAKTPGKMLIMLHIKEYSMKLTQKNLKMQLKLFHGIIF
jgi:hypothetical protein